MKKLVWLLAAFLTLVPAVKAELRLPAIIGDHMVLQQKLADPIWGWDTPGTKITVTFAGQTYFAMAGNDGKWMIKLPPMPANARPQTLTVTGSSQRAIQDVLIGEVWMGSGQSNMAFQLALANNGDLAAAAANVPNLRLILVPQVGTQKLQDDFKGQWRAATPATARGFSAVGFLFGRQLSDILKVPVGLIDNAWGGSDAEAWVRRSSLEQDPHFKAYLDWTVKKEAELQSAQGQATLAQATQVWKERVEEAKAEGKTLPRPPEDWLASQHRAGNIFAGVLNPTLGYGIKGVIWYQGESNVSRVEDYAYLFRFLIEQWRKEWGQGDFPFYWVQLPNFDAVKPLGKVTGRCSAKPRPRRGNCPIPDRPSRLISAKGTTFTRKTNWMSPCVWCAGRWPGTTV